MKDKKPALRIAIVGAGLSGLSLALALKAREDFHGEVHLYEPRPHYLHDRHWSFWQRSTHPFSETASTQQHTVDVVFPEKILSLDCHDSPYCVMRSDAVYESATEQLNSDARFQLHMSSIVIEVLAKMPRLEINFLHDKKELFDLVFDSRYLPDANSKGFRQWFWGAEISVPATHTAIRPRLMDFCLEKNQPIGFFYALPITNTSALVQLTYFLAPGEAAPDNAETLWCDYVTNTLKLDPEAIIRHENGSIPMARIHGQYKNAGHHAIGTAAGWVRTATGYGFLDIQRASQRMAQAILIPDPAKRELALRRVRARENIDDYLDDVFLRTLEREPKKAADFFYCLFKHTSSDKIIRFLSGEAGWADRLAIMQALPSGPFIKSLLTSLRS